MSLDKMEERAPFQKWKKELRNLKSLPWTIEFMVKQKYLGIGIY